jgi:23S rRNA (guanine745-N1)-methyltransferase
MKILRCPYCKTELHREGSSLYCLRDRPHCFDISKSGYVTLTDSPGTSGDDREMVKARTAFLDTGAYQPFADAIVKALDSSRVIIDAGCGEGYYTNKIASSLQESEVYGFDLSKYACDRAAKRAKASLSGAFFGVSSLFSLPVANNSADAVVNLFAPVAEREFSRVLRNGGLLIIGAAGKRHLFELKQALYTEAYENEARRDLPVGFVPIRVENVSYKFKCGGDDLKNLFYMTPYAFRTSPENAAKLDTLGMLEISADFDLFIYKKEEG